MRKSFLLYEKLFHLTKIFSVLMSVLRHKSSNRIKNRFGLECVCTEYGRTVQCVKFKSVILSVITDGNFDICPICPRGKNGRLDIICSLKLKKGGATTVTLPHNVFDILGVRGYRSPCKHLYLIPFLALNLFPTRFECEN
jgi:hypothetical protein